MDIKESDDLLPTYVLIYFPSFIHERIYPYIIKSDRPLSQAEL